MIIVRYADDFIVGFQYERDARRFLDELRTRLQEFALSLHAEKTRLIEFGRFAAKGRKARGLGKPETFNFLGFTFISRRVFLVSRNFPERVLPPPAKCERDPVKRAPLASNRKSSDAPLFVLQSYSCCRDNRASVRISVINAQTATMLENGPWLWCDRSGWPARRNVGAPAYVQHCAWRPFTPRGPHPVLR
jgi:hypothetical protein